MSPRACLMSILLGVMVWAPSPAMAQLGGPNLGGGDSMLEAIGKMVARADSVINRSAMGWNEGISMLGGLVKPSGDVGFTFTLRTGVRYVFIAAGDDDAEDV